MQTGVLINFLLHRPARPVTQETEHAQQISSRPRAETKTFYPENLHKGALVS